MRPGSRLSFVLLVTLAAPLQGQTLHDKFLQLFTYGACGEPLCLSVDAGRHEMHFNPSVVEGENNLLAFLNNAVGSSLSSLPLAAASGGTTFEFSGGAPVATSLSAGPIFAERAPTLGRGRWFFAAGVSGIDLTSIRGVPLNNLDLTFTHQNVADSALGNPLFENDLYQLNTAMHVNLLVSSVVLAYGLTNRIDLSVAVPFVRASLSGHTLATIVPEGFGIDTLVHFFGTLANPSLQANVASSGSATGIGDVAARVKVNLARGEHVGFSLLGGVRFPTGNADNFAGTGATDALGLAILSGRAGNFSPHLNAGFVHHGATYQNDAMLATVGFDDLITPRATLAVDLISSWQVGTQKLVLPGPVTYTYPYTRTIQLSQIPNERDNLIDLAVGTKIAASNNFNFVGNALLPVNRAGARANVVWTFGGEYNFYPSH